MRGIPPVLAAAGESPDSARYPKRRSCPQECLGMLHSRGRARRSNEGCVGGVLGCQQLSWICFFPWM